MAMQLTPVCLILFAILQSDAHLAKCLGSCCDKNPDCTVWAEEGQCVRNGHFVVPKCPVSCRSCPEELQQEPGKCTREVPTRRMFTRVEYDIMHQRQQCVPVNTPNNCSRNICYHNNHRTFDGSCNNINSSLSGAAFMPYLRLLAPNYDEGSSYAVGAKRGHLPHAHVVTDRLIRTQADITTTPANVMLMAFAHFLRHDMTVIAKGKHCTCSSNTDECSNLLRNDRTSPVRKCLVFTRAMPVCGTSYGHFPREQMNSVSSLIDGSQIYGSEVKAQKSLRKLRNQNHLLKVLGLTAYAPIRHARRSSFAIQSMYLIFQRFHNELAKRFRSINGHWDRQRVYQETRKVVGAYMQVLVYKEFLPALLGQNYSKLIPPYRGYNPEINPAVTSEFSAAAFRMHGFILEAYPLLDPQLKTGDNFSTNIEENVGNSEVDAIMRGLIASFSSAPQKKQFNLTDPVVDEERDFYSITIQRGRDLGFQPYNKYRALCKLRALETFDEWPEVQNPAVRLRFSELYNNSVDDIDLFVGGTLENPGPGGIVGPTFACLLVEQFIRSRDGDRFYYENEGVFTPAQVETLRDASLASVFCITGNHLEMTSNAFVRYGSNESHSVDCDRIPRVNLNLWKDQ